MFEFICAAQASIRLLLTKLKPIGIFLNLIWILAFSGNAHAFLPGQYVISSIANDFLPAQNTQANIVVTVDSSGLISKVTLANLYYTGSSSRKDDFGRYLGGGAYNSIADCADITTGTGTQSSFKGNSNASTSVQGTLKPGWYTADSSSSSISCKVDIVPSLVSTGAINLTASIQYDSSVTTAYGISHYYTLTTTGNGAGTLTLIHSSLFSSADTIPPSITSFTIPTSDSLLTSLTVPITSLTAVETPSYGFMYYMFTETATKPLSTDTRWKPLPPTSYTFASIGHKSLYAWAKDLTGNVSASSKASLDMGQIKQTISFDTAPSIQTGGTGIISATASSGLSLSYSSMTPSICSVTGVTVTRIKAGVCTISANQAGDSNYLPASQTQIVMENQTIYIYNIDGTVTDVKTGLTWMRCAVGQTWSGTTCSGTVSTYTWAQAVALTLTLAGKSDWRLPNIRELQTIVDRSIVNPSINATAFPNPSVSNFWSASAYAGSSDSAWSVYFDTGNSNDSLKSSTLPVRLVRGGSSLALLSESRADTDYTNNGDGTVTHKPTGLIWKQCSEGQTAGTTCSGTLTTYTWAQAMALTSTFAGKSDWRLPSEKELLTLADYTVVSPPSINGNLFSNTPASYFWSASALAGGSNNAWLVSFFDGSAYNDVKSSKSAVRLVRGGQIPSSAAGIDAPLIDSTIAGKGSATISFSPSSSNGGAAITGYIVTSNPDGVTAWGTNSPVTVNGLTSGTSYTFTVTAARGENISADSAASNAVTPTAALATFTVTASAGANGSIAPTSQTVTQGNSTSFTLSTGSGYTASASGCGGSLNGTTYTTAAITADCAVVASFSQSAVPLTLSLVSGWNLLGNSSNVVLDVGMTLNDSSKVQTVWKWLAASSKWAFYSPSLTGQALTNYVVSKGYEVLTSINGGEGFWVNAKAAFATQIPAGAALAASHFASGASPLPTGWNLIAVGDSPTPRSFANTIAATQPVAPNVVATSLTSLWAWDSTLSAWYFYAPSLDNSNGLASYLTNKGYLDFTAKNKLLTPTTGFWVNKP